METTNAGTVKVCANERQRMGTASCQGWDLPTFAQAQVCTSEGDHLIQTLIFLLEMLLSMH